MYSTRSKRKLRKLPSKISRSAGSVAKQRKKFTSKRENESSNKSVIKGSSNVFEDLGFDQAEAANLKIRADLMLDLRRHIQKSGWTQAQAAEFFGETQPRISNLLKGEINRFSVDKLIVMLARAGITVQVETKQRAA
jgi:predicted XRE-type DNA-binding protein